ncbi:hypothetical protein VQL36_15145 [Chengkuizengella sp. SCS-71B]|uniref:hypothetical protein n=1 Tax=Chengkuizengella sp. SCS-71B TaxID=3115290 RepID=UPI0032C21F68
MAQLLLFILIGIIVGICLISMHIVGFILMFAIIFGMLLKIIVQLSRIPKPFDPLTTKPQRRISRITEAEYNKYFKDKE